MSQTPRDEAGAWEGSGVCHSPPPQPCQQPGRAGLSATWWCQRNPPRAPSCTPRLRPWGFGSLRGPSCPPGPGLLGPVAQPRSSGRAYLDAPDDGVVHPAHVGQGRALHQDLHCLDGASRAEVVHGHLVQRAHPRCHHRRAREGARAAPGPPSPWAPGSPRGSPPPSPLPALPQPICSPAQCRQTQWRCYQPSWAHQTPHPAPPWGICPWPSPGDHQESPRPLLQPQPGSRVQYRSQESGRRSRPVLLGESGCPFPDEMQAATPADLIWWI